MAQTTKIPSTLATSLSMVLGVADRLFSPGCDFCSCSVVIKFCNSLRSLQKCTFTFGSTHDYNFKVLHNDVNVVSIWCISDINNMGSQCKVVTVCCYGRWAFSSAGPIKWLQIGAENSSFCGAKGRCAIEALCDALYKSITITTTTAA